MSDLLNIELKTTTGKRLDWRAIDDVFALIANDTRHSRAPATASAMPPPTLTDPEREAARKAFVVVKTEFGKTLGQVTTTMRWATIGIIAAVALAVAGGVLVQVSPWAGVISVASIASLFGLLPKTLALARDQAMLELVPTRYALALELCRTQKDLQDLLKRFLDETSSLRPTASKTKPAAETVPTVPHPKP